jgi:hypothetical protein
MAGPGVGSGGEPTMLSHEGLSVSNPMAHCDGLGNVLIVQASNVVTPIPNPEGGEIAFEMGKAGTVIDITLFNVLNEATIDVVKSSGIQTYVPVDPTGPNGIVTVGINVEDVKKVKVKFGGKGAVTGASICLKPTVIDPGDPKNDPSCSRTDRPSYNESPANRVADYQSCCTVFLQRADGSGACFERF